MLLISCSSEMGGLPLKNDTRVYELMNHSCYVICLFNIFCTNTQKTVEICRNLSQKCLKLYSVTE